MVANHSAAAAIASARKGQAGLSRRNAFNVLLAGVPFCLGTPGFGSSSTLVGLEKDLLRAIADCEWWGAKCSHARDTLDPIPFNKAFFEKLYQKSDEAWEHHSAIGKQICTLVANDMAGLMVQAQALATFAVRDDPDLSLLVNTFIRGLECIEPLAAQPTASDAALLSACADWNSALDEWEVANLVFEGIELPAWAKRYPKFTSDLSLRAALIAEHIRTGYQAALENLWSADARAGAAAEQARLMTASSVPALRAQAQPLTRNVHGWHRFNDLLRVQRIGMALVRGLEHLGGKRSLNLQEWLGPYADDVPPPD